MGTDNHNVSSDEPTSSTTSATVMKDSAQTTAAIRKNDVGNGTESTDAAVALAEDGIDRTAVIFPSNPMNVQGIIDLLSAYAGTYTHFQVASVGFTGYFIVPGLDQETLGKLQASKHVNVAMYLADWEKESERRHREAGGRVMARLSFDAGPIDTEDTAATPAAPFQEGSR